MESNQRNNVQPEITPAYGNEDHDAENMMAEKKKGADALLTYLDQSVTLDEATNKRLLRKIDTNVLPWLCGLYIFQYLDKGV